ncbi:hypothetical protein KC19_8G033000 [Ceratodon purpureus]|uniref:Uncharacterized protein n=1 Tax=Ceratodon purpureus TaxID=3225 RepID=A0A8T0GUU4_CERPU|nr:hypothetical protein KC19_8G033000 [Ceratodon purpureus]
MINFQFVSVTNIVTTTSPSCHKKRVAVGGGAGRGPHLHSFSNM